MYTKELIAEKLQTNNTWLFRGIVAIHNYQTAEEKAVGETRENNGVGFSGADANILSSFAEQIKRWESTPSRTRHAIPLSAKQLAIAKKKMIKYAGQLARIANANIQNNNAA